MKLNEILNYNPCAHRAGKGGYMTHKFRAWDKTENRWIKLQGFKIQMGELLPWEYRATESGTDEWVYVDDCDIQQFTGLKDKNGKEIYEGDIGEIRSQSGRIEKFIVEWGIHRREMKSGWTVDIPGFCFRIDGFPSFPIANNYLNGHDLDIIEIIGNIHEHPHLLTPSNSK